MSKLSRLDWAVQCLHCWRRSWWSGRCRAHLHRRCII